MHLILYSLKECCDFLNMPWVPWHCTRGSLHLAFTGLTYPVILYTSFNVSFKSQFLLRAFLRCFFPPLSSTQKAISLYASAWPECLCPPKFTCQNPDDHSDGGRKWVFWDLITSLKGEEPLWTRSVPSGRKPQGSSVGVWPRCRPALALAASRTKGLC